MFRAQLLAAKQINATASPVVANVPLKEKLRAELSKYVILVFVVFLYHLYRILEYRSTVGPKENPNAWWRVHHSQFPLLRKFWLALSAFPATSTSAERVFNMDGLVLSPNR